MKIKNIEVEFSFLNAEDVEKFEKEAEVVRQKCQKVKKNKSIYKSLSEALKEECKIIEDFFDNVFFKGISEKIFEKKNDLMEHIKAFDNIVQEKIKSQNDLIGIMKKYQPHDYTKNVNQKRNNKYRKH